MKLLMVLLVKLCPMESRQSYGIDDEDFFWLKLKEISLEFSLEKQFPIFVSEVLSSPKLFQMKVSVPNPPKPL